MPGEDRNPIRVRRLHARDLRGQAIAEAAIEVDKPPHHRAVEHVDQIADGAHAPAIGVHRVQVRVHIDRRKPRRPGAANGSRVVAGIPRGRRTQADSPLRLRAGTVPQCPSLTTAGVCDGPVHAVMDAFELRRS